MTHTWFWSALFLLGCYHGVNPGMGWLFAVALGLQERHRNAVFAALPPIVIGHVASVVGILALAALLQAALPQIYLSMAPPRYLSALVSTAGCARAISAGLA